MFFLPPTTNHLLVCSKGSILTIFRGRAVRHLRDIFVYFSGQEGAPDILSHCHDEALGQT